MYAWVTVGRAVQIVLMQQSAASGAVERERERERKKERKTERTKGELVC